MLDGNIISSAKRSMPVEMPSVAVSEGRAPKTNNAASLSSSAMILRRDFCGLEAGEPKCSPARRGRLACFPIGLGAVVGVDIAQPFAVQRLRPFIFRKAGCRAQLLLIHIECEVALGRIQL
jgi:hypothetical protein